jgi:hypothetical protein
MNQIRVIFVESEIGEKKGMFNYTSVNGELLAQDVEGCINEMRNQDYFFVRMEPVFGMRTVKGASAQTTIGYLLIFEDQSGTTRS